MDLYINENEKKENNNLLHIQNFKSKFNIEENENKKNIEDIEKIKQNNKESPLLLEHKKHNLIPQIIFKKYKTIKKIGQGSLTEIYEGINKIDKNKVAIKLELKQQNEKQLLEREAGFLYLLRDNPGIVKIISFGKTNKFNILIEPLLGKSLYDLYLQNKKLFTLKDICMIAIQCINRIETVHSKGIIHCDIKPENFVIDEKDQRMIYLIDFGLCKKYRSNRTHKHVQFSITKTLTGTARYASRYTLSGFQMSRRDDLESLSYMILYFLTKKLSWQGISAKTLESRYKKILIKKNQLEKWDKFIEIPIQIQKFIIYCRSLKFEQEPDYMKMKNFFKELMKEKDIIDDKDFSWIIDKSILDNKFPGEVKKKRENHHINLMKKITESANDIFCNVIEKNENNFETKKRLCSSTNHYYYHNYDKIDNDIYNSINAKFNEKIEEEKNKNI